MNTIGNPNAGESYIQPGQGSNVKASPAVVTQKIAEARDSIQAASDSAKAVASSVSPDQPVLPEGPSVNVDAQLLSMTNEVMGKTMAVSSALDELANLVAQEQQEALAQGTADESERKGEASSAETTTKNLSAGVGQPARTPVGAKAGANAGKSGSTDPEQAWFAATCFLTNFAIATMKASRTLSDMTAVQQQASIKMRQQERDNLKTEVDSIIDKGANEAKQLELQGESKIVTAGINLGMTAGGAAYGASVGTDDDAYRGWKKTQTTLDGVKSTASSLSDGCFLLAQTTCATNIAGDDAIRANAKDKYDTTISNRRATTDYLSKLRDTLNDFLSGLQRLLEEGYRVGQFTRN